VGESYHPIDCDLITIASVTPSRQDVKNLAAPAPHSVQYWRYQYRYRIFYLGLKMEFQYLVTNCEQWTCLQQSNFAFAFEFLNKGMNSVLDPLKPIPCNYSYKIALRALKELLGMEVKNRYTLEGVILSCMFFFLYYNPGHFVVYHFYLVIVQSKLKM